MFETIKHNMMVALIGTGVIRKMMLLDPDDGSVATSKVDVINLNGQLEIVGLDRFDNIAIVKNGKLFNNRLLGKYYPADGVVDGLVFDTGVCTTPFGCKSTGRFN